MSVDHNLVPRVYSEVVLTTYVDWNGLNFNLYLTIIIIIRFFFTVVEVNSSRSCLITSELTNWWFSCHATKLKYHASEK